MRTPVGTVLHTGDWKFDPDPLIGDVTDEAALRRLGDEGVLAMVCDSTNALRAGHPARKPMCARRSIELVGRCDSARRGRLLRLERRAAVDDRARGAAHGRHVALVGRSLWRIDKAARETGYLDRCAALPHRGGGGLSAARQGRC